MSTTRPDRDRLWLWGHEAGSHTQEGYWGIDGTSRMTPTEAAHYMGLDKVIMVRYDGLPKPPYDQDARALSSVGEVVWSVVGDAKTRDAPDESRTVADLASRFDNISGVMMDDFFQRTDASGERQLAAHDPAALRAMSDDLATVSGRPLDLWVIVYDHQLELPITEHLAACDCVNFWTWTAEELTHTRPRLKRVRELAPAARIYLGCYMWDYGNKREMPLAAMQAQCEEGAALIEEGLVEGLVFLASCICDLELPAVEYVRRWIRGDA